VVSVIESATSGDHLLRPDLEQVYPVFTAGEGVELIDVHGRRYLDAASGVGVTCLGYGAVEVVEAMTRQARVLPYVHSLRFETQPMRRLADMIAEVAPGDLNTVFFVSGGSEANETAFKFARQYWLERGEPERWRIIGRRPSFHGNTLATLAAGWHDARRRRHAPLLLDFPHVETPNQYRGCPLCAGGCTLACADQLDEVIRQVGPETVAAFIAEPVLGAAAAALVPPDGYFRRVREICDRHGILLVADEVITGVGRTGRWFGIEHFGVQPDIVTFAKGIAGGYAPLGGMVVRDALLEAFRDGSGRFEHNFTMAGHPVACACGIATLEVLSRDRLVERVAELGPGFLELLHERVGDLPIVGDVRGIGFLAGVELVADRTTHRPFPPEEAMSVRATRYAMEEGVVVYACSGGVEGKSGDYLLLMPPFISTEEQLHDMVHRLARGLARLCRDRGMLDPKKGAM
jgi:adenosylmethionine-8-amino-7-oxononanoate aminotransferase